MTHLIHNQAPPRIGEMLRISTLHGYGSIHVRAVSDSPVDCLKPDCRWQSVRAFGVAESGFREAEDSGVGYADHAATGGAVCHRLLCSSPFLAVLRNVS